jgi:hypothetical protein
LKIFLDLSRNPASSGPNGAKRKRKKPGLCEKPGSFNGIADSHLVIIGLVKACVSRGFNFFHFAAFADHVKAPAR